MESIFNALAGAFSTPLPTFGRASQVASSQSQTERDEIDQSSLPVLERQKRTKKRKLSEDGQKPPEERKRQRALEKENISEGIPLDMPQQLPFQPIDTLEKQAEAPGKKRRISTASLPSSSQLTPAQDPSSARAAPSAKPKNSQKAPSIASSIPPPSRIIARTEASTATRENQLEMLATKWLNAGALKKLAEEEGVQFKFGVFSKEEARQIENRIEAYKKEWQLTDADISSIVFTKGKGQRKEHSGFMAEIARSVPGRPLNNVFSYLRRKHHPQKAKGAWTAEEDNELRAAYAELGPQWEKIAINVDRPAGDCRDRYRNHIVGKEERSHGHWSKDEEESLIRAVEEVAAIQGKDLNDTRSDVFWTIVAARMGHKRSRAQCRIKWTDGLLPRRLQNGVRVRWTPAHTKILIERVRAQEARDISEVDFNRIITPDFNAHSAHTLQKKMSELVGGIIGNKGENLNEVLDRILDAQERHSQSRESTAAPPSIRHMKSQAIVDSDSSEDDDGGVDLPRSDTVRPRASTSGEPHHRANSTSPEVVDTSKLPRQRGPSIYDSAPSSPRVKDQKSTLQEISQGIAAASSSSNSLPGNERTGLQTATTPHESSTEEKKKKKKKRQSEDQADRMESTISGHKKKKTKRRSEGDNEADRVKASNESAMVETTADTPHMKEKKHRKENADASIPVAAVAADLPSEDTMATSKRRVKKKKRKSDAASVPTALSASDLQSEYAIATLERKKKKKKRKSEGAITDSLPLPSTDLNSVIPDTPIKTSEIPKKHKKKKGHYDGMVTM